MSFLVYEFGSHITNIFPSWNTILCVMNLTIYRMNSAICRTILTLPHYNLVILIMNISNIYHATQHSTTECDVRDGHIAHTHQKCVHFARPILTLSPIYLQQITTMSPQFISCALHPTPSPLIMISSNGNNLATC